MTSIFTNIACTFEFRILEFRFHEKLFFSVNNGYHIVYLSARAIGQASITKDYLASIKQGEVNLPDGPIFLNPTSLVNAFHREVIIKKPEEFKIACMTDIKRLFPETKNPFYAGYGNRVNVSDFTKFRISIFEFRFHEKMLLFRMKVRTTTMTFHIEPTANFLTPFLFPVFPNDLGFCQVALVLVIQFLR